MEAPFEQGFLSLEGFKQDFNKDTQQTDLPDQWGYLQHVPSQPGLFPSVINPEVRDQILILFDQHSVSKKMFNPLPTFSQCEFFLKKIKYLDTLDSLPGHSQLTLWAVWPQSL